MHFIMQNEKKINKGLHGVCMRVYHAAKHRMHTRSWALLATYPYTTRHAATEPGLYNESNQ